MDHRRRLLFGKCFLFVFRSLLVSGMIHCRVNTFRRLDLLEIFLDSHAHCSVVDEITVVWSDLQNKAPLDWQEKYPKDVVKFEIHDKNSLNNRFYPLSPIRTTGVLSVDDDLSIPCNQLEFAVRVWAANKDAMVGFSPRLTTRDVYTGLSKYLRWQHTWWNGKYTLMLTKVALIHKKYLDLFQRSVPENVLNYIDKHRNCEDIVMAHVISQHTQLPPVWLEAVIFDTGLTTGGGISSGGTHFVARGDCVDMMVNVTGVWPWVLGYQKSIPMGAVKGDYFGVTDWMRYVMGW
jgi:hypothetical protein